MMWKHFSALHQYLRGLDTLSPLAASTNSDVTFCRLGDGHLRAFSSRCFSFEGAQRGGQLVELRGQGGASEAPAGLRVAVARVE